MAQRAPQLPTFGELYRQIEALPQGVTGEILEPGVIRAMSRPGGPHRRSHRRITDSLRGSDIFVGGSGWWFEIEAEIRFLEELLAVPDVSGWRVEEPPSFLAPNPIEVVPDFSFRSLQPTPPPDDPRFNPPPMAPPA